MEARIQVFQNLAGNPFYNHFNLVLEELIQRVRYNQRWTWWHARDVAVFYL